MQKKFQPVLKQGYPEQQERYPPEPEPLYEAFPSHYNQGQYSGNIQDHTYPQPRNTDPRRTNKSRNENRSPQHNNQDNQPKNPNSIYKRYTSNPEAIPNDDDNYQDLRETEPIRQDKQAESYSKGFHQSATSNFYSQDNTYKALEDQYQFVCHQNEELKKQMALLKISMYNETLTNEEQRAYIEILKQALETKIDETGLLKFLKSFNQGSSESEADLYLELTNMRGAMETIQRDKALNDERIQDLHEQVEVLSVMNDKLKQERNQMGNEYEKLTQDMPQVFENLRLMKDENDKLNQEKDSLLDYIEELRTRLEQLEQENRNYNEELQQYENKFNQLQAEENNEEYYEDIRRDTNDLDDVIEVDEGNENNSSQNQYEEGKRSQNQYEEGKRSQGPTQKKTSKKENDSLELEPIKTASFKNAQRSNEELDQNYNVLEEELIEENQNLRTNYEALGQQVFNLQQAYDEQVKKFEKANELSDKLLIEKKDCLKDLEKLREQNSQLELMTQQYQEQIESLKNQTSRFEEDAQKVETLEQNNTELEREIIRYKELVEETRIKNEKDRQAKAEEIKTLYQQASDLRIELRDLKESYQRLKAERDSFEVNIGDLKEELDKRQKTIISHLKEVNDLKQLSEEKQEQLDLKITQIERFETQVNELNRFVEECDEKVKLAYEAEEKLTRDLEGLTRENKRIKEENKEIQQKFEKNKREIDQSKQTLTEIIRTISGESLSSENLETSLIGINERAKGLKRSEENNKKRIYELEQQNNVIREEITRLEERNKKMSKNETEVYTENRRLRAELEQLQDEINKQQIKNDKIREEFERLKVDFDKRRKDDDQSFKEKAKYLEEKVTRLITEKSSLEYVVARYREVTLNGEINDLIDEAKVAHTQISYLDKDKLDLQVKLDIIKNKETLAKRGSPIKLNETANKRSVEEIKEGLAEVEVNTEIYSTKKHSIEKELVRLMEKEREKHFNYFEFERQNYQLKAELDLMTKENQLIEQTRETLEASYNDLVKEIRRSRIDDRLNASIYSPGGGRLSSPRRNFSPEERRSYTRKNYYGKPELEKTKDQDFRGTTTSMRKELENTGYLSRKTSGKYIHSDDNEIQKHTANK